MVIPVGFVFKYFNNTSTLSWQGPVTKSFVFGYDSGFGMAIASSFGWPNNGLVPDPWDQNPTGYDAGGGAISFHSVGPFLNSDGNNGIGASFAWLFNPSSVANAPLKGYLTPAVVPQAPGTNDSSCEIITTYYVLTL